MFGISTSDVAEKIESNDTDLTISSGAKIKLSATSDVEIPNNVGIAYGTAGEKIESDGTDLTVTSTGVLNLTATVDTAITNNATIGGNLVLTGNLTVNGSTSTVSSVNTTIADNIIELNTGISASSNDAGIIIERGSTGNNAAIIFDESADKFAMGLTTSTAADKSGGITVSTGTLLANLEGNVTGDVTGTADVATVATTVTITDNESTNENNAMIFTAGGDTDGGNLGLESDGTCTYNPSTGKITATGFVGALTGNASGSSGSCTGNAASATILETTRAIGGVNFNGSAAINLPGVNTAGNQDTSGTAAIATTVTAADESSDTSCNVLFVTAATGNLPPKTGTNLTFNSSAGTLTTTTFVGDLTGTASAAEYSDVAERFASDSAYTPGTVVALGGSEEITQVNEEGSDEVFGVVSSLKQAAFKMNAGAGDDDTHPYIAMTGRVNVKVIGTVNKGDRLISASVPGYARAATKAECTAFNVIGRALTGKTEAGQGSVKAAVRVSH